jgi:hypothetical protein
MELLNSATTFLKLYVHSSRENPHHSSFSNQRFKVSTIFHWYLVLPTMESQFMYRRFLCTYGKSQWSFAQRKLHLLLAEATMISEISFLAYRLPM